MSDEDSQHSREIMSDEESKTSTSTRDSSKAQLDEVVSKAGIRSSRHVGKEVIVRKSTQFDKFWCTNEGECEPLVPGV